MYNVYSLTDTKAVLTHPYVGTANLHLCGRGRMVVSFSGDMSAHTMTADGTVIINRLKAENGIITLEVPQNSIADEFLRKWCKYLRNTARPDFFHLTTLTITDQAGGFTLLCSVVTPQKIPDRTFDRSSTNLTYTLLAASITEQ